MLSLSQEYVARIHTDTPGKKSKINVDIIHINALLGYVETVLIGGIKTMNLDRDTEYKAIAAFGKLLWIQMDFFLKFYCKDGEEYLPESEEKVEAFKHISKCTCLHSSTALVSANEGGFFARLWKLFL